MARTGNADEELAGGAPLTRGPRQIASIIRARTQAVEITRATESTGSLDETTETTSTFTEDLWLGDVSESLSSVVSGDRSVGTLTALGLDGIDIEVDDRLSYGGVEYEVDTVVGRPADADADGTSHDGTRYFAITLERRQ